MGSPLTLIGILGRTCETVIMDMASDTPWQSYLTNSEDIVIIVVVHSSSILVGCFVLSHGMDSHGT